MRNDSQYLVFGCYGQQGGDGNEDDYDDDDGDADEDDDDFEEDVI